MSLNQSDIDEVARRLRMGSVTPLSSIDEPPPWDQILEVLGRIDGSLWLLSESIREIREHDDRYAMWLRGLKYRLLNPYFLARGMARIRIENLIERLRGTHHPTVEERLDANEIFGDYRGEHGLGSLG